MTGIQVRNGIIALIVLCVIIIVGFIFIQPFLSEKQITTDSLESMQLNPPQDYIQKLTGIIQTNRDPYIRESAVFTLTDIAIKKNETGRIYDFLREIATNEKETNVQSAAFATIYRIKTVYPEEPKATLDVTIQGPIQQGANITLIATVSFPNQAVKAIVGINRFSNTIELLSNPVVKLNLSDQSPRAIPFKIKILRKGSYYIPVTLKVSYNRVDEDTIKKRIIITVNETSGSYKILNEGEAMS